MANRRPLPLKRAIDGWLRWCAASGYSPNTLNDYQRSSRYFADFISPDTPINSITSDDVERWMLHMQQLPPSQCHGATAGGTPRRKKKRRAPKTMQNYHTALSSLWTWATKHGHAEEHILRSVTRPKVPATPIEPLTADQVVQLLRACNESRAWKNKPLTTSRRPTAERDKAIIAVFVETGIRCTELCEANVGDVTWMRGGGKIVIREGKGRKMRIVPFSIRCANYLNEYLLTRDDVEDHRPLFLTQERNPGLRMTRDNVYKLVSRLGRRIGVTATPHQLRTTSACLLAVNGMSAFELQRVMGHEEIDTTMRYVQAANLDLSAAMSAASPLDNLRL